MSIKISRISLLAAAAFLPAACLFSQTVPKIVFSAPHKVVFGSASSPSFVVPIVAGDVYGNGKTDILAQVVANEIPAAQNALLAGDGKGGFSEGNFKGATVNEWSTFADVNGDGHLDIITPDGGSVDNSNPDCNTITPMTLNVSLGDGHGNFHNTLLYFTQYLNFNMADVVVGDFNGDKKPDIALFAAYGPPGVECSNGPLIFIFLNNGQGGFTEGQVLNVGSIVNGPDQMATGDFNGDGHADLAILDPRFQQIYVMYGNGDGTFRTGFTYTFDSTPLAMFAGNMNGDNKTDLVVDATARNAPTAYPRIATLLAKQTGGFYWASAVSVAGPPQLYPLVDLNGDGKLDILTSTFLSSSQPNNTIQAFANQGNGRFVRPPQTIVSNSHVNYPMALPFVTGGRSDIIYFSNVPSKALSLEELFNESK